MAIVPTWNNNSLLTIWNIAFIVRTRLRQPRSAQGIIHFTNHTQVGESQSTHIIEVS